MTEELLQLKSIYKNFGNVKVLKDVNIKINKGEVVALIGDSTTEDPHGFKFSQKERCEALSLIGIVDAIILLRSNELPEVVDIIEPSKLVLGKEFEHSKYPHIYKSINLQITNNRQVKFHAGDINYATHSV